MYCPVCFNDTLKIASSGVVKFSFNGKAKATSQMYYNLTQDRDEDLLKKVSDVIEDYFKYYSGFQNKDPIQFIEAISIDFKCNNKCVINVNTRVNVIGILFSQNQLQQIVEENAKKHNIPLDLKDPN